MTDREYFTKKISYIHKLATEKFATRLDIAKILFDDIETGENSYATIFQLEDGRVYVLHEDDTPITLSDVRHKLKSLGVEVGGVLPPYGDKLHFARHGHEAFMLAYPGRTIATDEEKSFYETQTIYNPAIFQISKSFGELRRYSADSSTWKVTDKFRYDRQWA